jgi:hypothetical protein
MTGPAGGIYSYQKPTLKPSTTYTIQGYIKTSSIPTTEFGSSMRYANVPGTVEYTAKVNGTSDWTFVSKTFTTASDWTSSSRLDLFSNFTTGIVWFDDVALCEGSCGTATTPTPFVTPSPTRTPTQVPTSTPIPPTPTPLPQSIKVGITLLLHGIGKGGDSVDQNALGNQTPITPQRSVTLQLINDQNVVISQPTGLLTYTSTTGDFKGTVDVGTAVPGGTYQVKVKTPLYLSSQIGSFFTLSQGQTTTLPSTTLVVGDSNNDNLLNILDYNLLLDCYSVFEPAKNCDSAKQKSTDLNDDGKVNTTDTNLWLRELSVQSGK